MYSDRVHWLREVRAQLLELSTPFYTITDLPGRLKDWGSEVSLSRSSLIEDNNRLRAEALVLQSKIQKLAALATENVRLRELLNSSALLQDNVVVAEIIGVSPDPLRHLVLVNRGSEDKVFVGQPVLDANGLFGQVVEVSSSTCRVLLITDSTHAIPVQVNRNGVRAIAEGTGIIHELELRHLTETTDIVEGDMLVSSGLGGRFPVGYPVATVTRVVRDPGQKFLRVVARPMAQLDRSRHVLLLFSAPAAPPPSAEAVPATEPPTDAGAKKP
jgi:rod shape-determining protein MreC